MLSELRRANPEPRVVVFVASQPLDQLYISVVTLAEIRFGIDTVADPDRRLLLHTWLTERIRPMFEGRTLQVSEDAMVKWRVLVKEDRKAGHTFSQPDLIIAATGIHHGLTVVTRDRGDFDKTRVPVPNPWDAV